MLQAFVNSLIRLVDKCTSRLADLISYMSLLRLFHVHEHDTVLLWRWCMDSAAQFGPLHACVACCRWNKVGKQLTRVDV